MKCISKHVYCLVPVLVDVTLLHPKKVKGKGAAFVTARMTTQKYVVEMTRAPLLAPGTEPLIGTRRWSFMRIDS